ncbi:MAG: hypothetical protein LBB74_02500 [Chitinispirillales bacterium]|jgi:hypothetical protein|nr:hypothetical protein [Chitinispirillales bacterium]
MSVNELNGGSAGTWNRFVNLKEAAHKRNFGPGVKGSSGASNTGGTTKFSEILSSKGGANVYLDPNVKALQNTLASVRAGDLPAKGKMFDSYA